MGLPSKLIFSVFVVRNNLEMKQGIQKKKRLSNRNKKRIEEKISLHFQRMVLGEFVAKQNKQNIFTSGILIWITIFIQVRVQLSLSKNIYDDTKWNLFQLRLRNVVIHFSHHKQRFSLCQLWQIHEPLETPRHSASASTHCHRSDTCSVWMPWMLHEPWLSNWARHWSICRIVGAP